MTIDRETVIKALQCRKNAGHRFANPCEENGACHYACQIRDINGDPYFPYLCDTEKICSDSLALLEPRVLTLDEVKTAEGCMEPVFLEMCAESESPDVFSWRTVRHIVPLTDKDIYVFDNAGFSSALYSEHYGMTWRCWNKKPTYEQRKAVKWNDAL